MPTVQRNSRPTAAGRASVRRPRPDLCLSNATLVTPEGLRRADLAISAGRIDRHPTASAAQNIDFTGKYILPGFVDIHTHGRQGFDFTMGRFDPDSQACDASEEAFAEGLDMLARIYAGHGVTTAYLASFAAGIETLSHAHVQLARYRERHANRTDAARLAGAFLEGSFINPDMAGAQNPRHVFAPDLAVFEQIAGRETIKLANIVPDAGAAAYRFIEQLTERGVVVGFGHTNATARQVREAVAAGLRYCVHFTNGPTGGSFKPFEGGGAVEAVLSSDELYAELIMDGFHVNPAYVLDIIRRKGPERIIGVTDAMFAAGLEVGSFEMGGITGRANAENTCLFVAEKANTLFGSCLAMSAAFENLLNWMTVERPGVYYRRHAGRDMEACLGDLARIFAANPAELLGCGDEIGSLAHGGRADLAVLDIAGEPGEYRVEVVETIVGGRPTLGNKAGAEN